MKIEKLVEVLNAHFGKPFLDEGHVEAKIKDGRLFLRIGRRDIDVDDAGVVHGTGTCLLGDKALQKLKSMEGE